MATDQGRTKFGHAEPILRVSDMGASVLYYTRVRQPPCNYPWALEIHVEDPDGHILRFGSEPLTDRPFDRWAD